MAIWLKAGGVFVFVFGLVTLLQGGKLLFSDSVEWPAGVVPFVLIFNFCAGFLYLLAGVGLFKTALWSRKLVFFLAVSNLLVFAALFFHIYSGGEYMTRTLAAMTLRSLVWIALSLVLIQSFKKGEI